MKGKIEPYEKYVKVNNIGEAHSLVFETDQCLNDMDAKTHILTEIVKALIISNQTFKSDDALITRALNITNKILGKATDKTT